MTSLPRVCCVTVPLVMIGILGLTACGPGVQVLEQQQRQLNATQQLIDENRRLIEAERDRLAQQQQRAYEELQEENRRLALAESEKDRLARERQRAYEELQAENRRLVLAEQERLDREWQRAQDQLSNTGDTLTQPGFLATGAGDCRHTPPRCGYDAHGSGALSRKSLRRRRPARRLPLRGLVRFPLRSRTQPGHPRTADRRDLPGL